MHSNHSPSAKSKSSVEVRDSPDDARYEVLADGELAGFAQYRLHHGRITFFHTEIDSAHEGRGIGAELARYALDDAKARGLSVVPLCPFIAGFIRRHSHDYLALVVPNMQKRVMDDEGQA
jgi:uncharacterized protein